MDEVGLLGRNAEWVMDEVGGRDTGHNGMGPVPL